MKRTATTLIVAAALAAAPLAALASPSSQDLRFATGAARAGKDEIADATVAKRDGSNPVVMAFANRMIRDHRLANVRLKSIAKSEGIALPPNIGFVAASENRTLMKARGRTFDTTYLEMERYKHAGVIAAFQKEIDDGSDPRLVRFAKTTLPVLKAHLAMDYADIRKLGTAMTPESNMTKTNSM